MIRNEKLNNTLYALVVFLLFLGYYSSNIYNLTIIKSISGIFIFLLTFFKLLSSPLKVKDFLLFGIIFFCTIFLKKFYLSFYLVFISKDIILKKRIKSFLFVSLFFYILTILLDSFNFLEFNRAMEHERIFNGQKVLRQTLGYEHPNNTMMFLLPLFFCLYYLYSSYKIYLISIYLFSSKIIFNYTNSRTGMVLVILFIICILIPDNIIKKIKKLLYVELISIFILSIYVAINYPTSILNKIVSGRLWLFSYYLKNIKITYMGTSTISLMYEKFPLDNTYLRVIFEQGILGIVLLIVLIIYVINLLYKYGDYKAIRIMIIILIFGLLESQALNYYFNIIYLLVYRDDLFDRSNRVVI